MAGLGLGIALSGTPRRAIDYAYQSANRRQAMEAQQNAAAGKKRTLDEKALGEIREKEFKVDPKIYHRKLIPLVSKRASEVFNEVLTEYRNDPYNWQNNVQQKILGYQDELTKFKQQSDMFFDYEKQDPTKVNIDDRVIKALSNNPGDLTDLEDLYSSSKGLKGYSVGNTGFWSFSPIPKIDLRKEFEEFNRTPTNFSESRGGATSSGIPGVMNIVTNNTPIPERVTSLQESLSRNKDYLAQVVFDTPDDQIPSNVSLDDPTSVAAFGGEKIKQDIKKSITSYKRTTPHNVPKDEKTDGSVNAQEWVKIGNGYGLKVGNSLWTVKFDDKSKKYFVSIASKSKTGEQQDLPEMDWTYGQGGKTVTDKGKLVGFYYNDADQSLRTSISVGDKVQMEAAGGTTTEMVGDRKVIVPTDAEGNALTQAARKYKDIGYSTETRQKITGEYGIDPASALTMLLKKNYNMDINGEILNQKPFQWGTDTKSSTGPRTTEQVGDSLSGSGFWETK